VKVTKERKIERKKEKKKERKTGIIVSPLVKCSTVPEKWRQSSGSTQDKASKYVPSCIVMRDSPRAKGLLARGMWDSSKKGSTIPTGALLSILTIRMYLCFRRVASSYWHYRSTRGGPAKARSISGIGRCHYRRAAFLLRYINR
jgi:hypothetical protein